MNRYIPAIDGLRAIAVLSVIVNHFNSTLLPGGYLGVDIFFVISGFVITSSLVSRNETRAWVFFSGFYKRRIKRLLPALLFCFSITAVLISFFNPSPQEHLITGLFSIIGFSNINLYLNSIDYWGEDAALNPFTHTWSLGVEEQFYFLFPLTVWLFLRGNWNALKARQLLLFITVISIISLVYFVLIPNSNKVATYFLMPFRFWEIGLGCSLFVYLKQGARYTKPFIKAIPITALLLLITLIFFVPEKHSELATLAIVFCTLLLLSKITITQENNALYTGLLTHRIILYIGLISYSLYLWHWVIIVISRWTIGIDLWTAPFQIVLIILLAITSYHVIEKPFRHTSWRSSKSIKTILSALLTIIALSMLCLNTETKLNSLYLGNKEKQNNTRLFYVNSELDCNNNHNGKKKQTIRTLGNSHSLHILPMLNEISKKCGFDIIHQTHPDYIVIPSGNHQSIDMLDDVLSTLNKGDLLILSSRNMFLYSIPFLNLWGNKWIDHSAEKLTNGFGLDNWLIELDELIRKSEKIGVNIVLFLPNVEFDKPVANYEKMCMGEWFKKLPVGCNPKVSKEFLNRRFPISFYKEVRTRAAQKINFYIFDPMPIYCPQETECSRIIDGVVAFKDTNHLTNDGAKLMLDKFSLFLARHKLIR